ncbi:sensor histidine kinase [Mycetocola spongiae]|uniref:sensor histidine kinase n=1 Tax=Mycetocola spongiae TaxID=2859226 RepID=UPI001CF452D8|nr:ATP-binding protein [Mycetocola spongiae]UCR87941.1 hypothetical protein KXZ72_07910 [Mycetocola spongiae]
MNPRTRRRRNLEMRAVNIAVDLGFAVLLGICAARYFSRHSATGIGLVVVILVAGVALSYAAAVLGGRRAREDAPLAGAIRLRRGVGILISVGLWIPLTIIAPSFAWCAFALFFAVHRVLRGRVALWVSLLIVVSVSVGLLLMSRGDDPGLVLGPLVGGLVLAYAFSALESALAAERSLNSELIEARSRLAQAERSAGALIERNRMASELHDTVVQRTASALMLLETEDLTGGSSSDALVEAKSALRESLIETRQLMHGLTSPRAEDALADTLREIAEEFGARFELHGSVAAVSTPIAHALQRVSREALQNTRKHAGADAVLLMLVFSPGVVQAIVSDNGTGFDPAAAASPDSSGGFGLRAMAWRMSTLGGTLSVDSSPGAGTRIFASVPLTDGGAGEGRRS